MAFQDRLLIQVELPGCWRVFKGYQVDIDFYNAPGHKLRFP